MMTCLNFLSLSLFWIILICFAFSKYLQFYSGNLSDGSRKLLQKGVWRTLQWLAYGIFKLCKQSQVLRTCDGKKVYMFYWSRVSSPMWAVQHTINKKI